MNLDFCTSLLKSLFMIFTLFCTMPAYAQAIEGQSSNRVICDSVKNLELHVRSLPTAESNAKGAKANSAIALSGCAWHEGKGYMNHIEIGEIAGWLHSGDYIMSVHALKLSDGRNFYHSSVIRRLDEWRLADDCGVSIWKTQFLNGEKHRFFGTDRKGIKNHCKSLINRQTEANELNQPITALSDYWQSRPEDRQLNVCTTLDAAANGMDKVINEQQINNNDDYIFEKISRCYQASVNDIVASRYLGLYLSTRADGGAQFWFEVQYVAYLNKGTGIINYAYMPTRPTRRKFLRVSDVCQSTSANLGERRSVQLYGARHADLPATPILVAGKRYSLDPVKSTTVGLAECRIGRTWSR